MISKERLEAEVEFYAKYGNVEKTVKMPVPPTWEEVNDLKNQNSFVGLGKTIFEITFYYLRAFNDIFCIYKKNDYVDFNGYIFDYSKQGYYKALDKMVELWREEV